MLVACLALESVERGFVSRHLNIIWLVLFVFSASCAALLMQPPGTVSEARRNSSSHAATVLRFALLALTPAVWVFFPSDARFFWRAAASGGVLLAALASWAIFSKNE